MEIYLLVCPIYDMNKHLHWQDNRNGEPTLAVPEPDDYLLVRTIKRSFQKRLIDKTDIQRASQVCSIEGVLVHCLGKLSFALLLLAFYY